MSRYRPTEVIQKASPPADHLQQSATTGEVFPVRLQVFRKVGHPIRENRDLNFSRAGVVIGPLEFPNYFLFTLFRNRHQ